MLKTIFICGSLIFFSFLSRELLGAERSEDLDRSLHRIASYVEYVAADYPGAVREDGTVIEEGEYVEQKGLLEEASTQAAELTVDSQKQQGLLNDIEAIRSAVLAKKPPLEIQTLSRAVRRRLEEDFGLRIEPSGHVSLEQAQPVFQQYCASCHGLTGHADTPMAKVLKPAPVSFFDEKRMVEISPTLAYHALTFGVAGTGMASFDYLSASQRWNLAFYVLSLRHPKISTAEKALIAQKAVPLTNLKELASKNDTELLKEIATTTKDPIEQTRILDYLRTQVGNASSDVGAHKHFTHLLELLSEASKAAEQGNMKQAYDLSASAYLDEFEPYEGLLRTKNGDLVTNLEGLFQELRQITKKNPPNIDQFHQTVNKIRTLLEEAETILQIQGSGSSDDSGKKRSFWSSFAPVLGITLREGFEVMLLVSFLLAYLRKSGQAKKAHIVHIGWSLAMVAGFFTYIITYLVLKNAFSGQKRELIEAISTFLALAILLPLTHSILGAKEARQWLGFLGKKLDSLQQDAMTPGKNLFRNLALFGIAFFAVYREMVETILFYRPYLEDGGWASQQALGLGVLFGILLIGGVAFFISYTGKRLNPRPVMRISSFFLGVICVSMAGQGVHALQEAGVLAPHQISLAGYQMPSFSWLGIYANWPGIALQLIVLGILVFPPLLVWYRKRTNSL